MNEKYGIVYLITNTLTGKKYVGQTVHHIDVRFKAHCEAFHSNSYLTKAILKYGKENFTKEIIYTATSMDDLNEKEIQFISSLNTMTPNGYNLKEGGSSSRMHQDVIEKIRASKTGKTTSKRRWIQATNISTNHIIVFHGVVSGKDFGFSPSYIRSILCGSAKSLHKGYTFNYIYQVNQSGSVENKDSSHAQRIEGEPVNAEHNPSTSPQYPSKYLDNKQKIITLYEELNSSYKVAEILNLDSGMIKRWLKSWGKLKTQSQAYSQRNKNRYKLSEDFISFINTEYQKCGSAAKIAKDNNLSYKTVLRALDKG